LSVYSGKFYGTGQKEEVLTFDELTFDEPIFDKVIFDE
jgi:hypothetical protein